MATTVATLATNIITRLLIGTTTQEPSAANVQQWVRDGFKSTFAALNPIFRTTGTVASAAVSVSNDRVMYVVIDGLVLFHALEYQNSGSTVTDLPKRYNGMTAVIYYCKVPDLTAATIESSCIFGTDWLEPLVSTTAEMTALEHLWGTSTAGSSTAYQSQYRILQTERDKLEAALSAQRNSWIGTMEQALNDRRLFGPRPRRDHAWSGFKKVGRITNPLTGVDL